MIKPARPILKDSKKENCSPKYGLWETIALQKKEIEKNNGKYMIDHGYTDIEEYVEDIKLAIDFLNLKRGWPWKFVPPGFNTEIDKPNFVQVGWLTHYVAIGSQYYGRRDVDGEVLNQWFLYGVPFTPYKRNEGWKRWSDTSKPLEELSIWAKLDNNALPYIRLHRDYMKYVIEHKENCLYVVGKDVRLNNKEYAARRAFRGLKGSKNTELELQMEQFKKLSELNSQGKGASYHIFSFNDEIRIS